MTGDAIYTTLGRNDGIKDSTILVAYTNKMDSVATLKVFATSSKSSVCRILNSKRKLVIGDSIYAEVMKEVEIIAQKPLPILTNDPSIISVEKSTIQTLPFLSLKGRTSIQYYTSVISNLNQIVTQPGLVVNLRGTFNNTPLKFELYGNLRTRVLGTQSPFGSTSQSQTRLYNAFLEYDDSINKVSIGRIIPRFAPSIGYIDGFLAARKFSNYTFGVTAGYEPNFLQQGISTAYKKFSLFGNYQSDKALRPFINVAYTRTYYYSLLDREAISAYFFGSFSNNLSLSAQTEIDLKSKSGTSLKFSPHVTTLYSNITYRLNTVVNLGLGYSAWTPTYSYSTIQNLPDSMIDRTTRVSLSTTVSAYLPYGIALFNTYSPRSSNESFGKEYSNIASVSYGNLFNQSISTRLSWNLNSTLYSKNQGFGISLERMLANVVDVTTRYTYYNYNVQLSDLNIRSHTIGIDVMTFLSDKITVWGSYENLSGSNIQGYNIVTELSWRF